MSLSSYIAASLSLFAAHGLRGSSISISGSSSTSSSSSSSVAIVSANGNMENNRAMPEQQRMHSSITDADAVVLTDNRSSLNSLVPAVDGARAFPEALPAAQQHIEVRTAAVAVTMQVDDGGSNGVTPSDAVEDGQIFICHFSACDRKSWGSKYLLWTFYRGECALGS